MRTNSKVFNDRRRGRLAKFLPICVSSVPMVRVSVFSIVLVLAIGQDTALLCRAWCHPSRAATAECQEQSGVSTSASVTADENCERLPVSGPMLIRNDVRRISDQQGRYAVVVRRHLMPAATSEQGLGTDFY